MLHNPLLFISLRCHVLCCFCVDLAAAHSGMERCDSNLLRLFQNLVNFYALRFWISEKNRSAHFGNVSLAGCTQMNDYRSIVFQLRMTGIGMDIHLTGMRQNLHSERRPHGARFGHGVFRLSKNVCLHHAGSDAVDSSLHTCRKSSSGHPHFFNLLRNLDAADFVARRGNVTNHHIRRCIAETLIVLQADKIAGKANFRCRPVLRLQPGAHHGALVVLREHVSSNFFDSGRCANMTGLHPQAE
ncbi:hypothetical protein SDC9_152874 [bioreactor metagenome]|uniref:Uncharacterized protein n=1 Tax=bioreactor metagenome TaxID=1076179 RepID=A0A645EYY7_9ZZZZ